LYAARDKARRHAAVGNAPASCDVRALEIQHQNNLRTKNIRTLGAVGVCGGGGEILLR